MKVWVEGMDGGNLSRVNVFSSAENAIGYWRREFGLSDEMVDCLKDDAMAMLSGTSSSASIGLCKFIDGIGTVFLSAVPVDVDSYYERINKTEKA